MAEKYTLEKAIEQMPKFEGVASAKVGNDTLLVCPNFDSLDVVKVNERRDVVYAWREYDQANIPAYNQPIWATVGEMSEVLDYGLYFDEAIELGYLPDDA